MLYEIRENLCLMKQKRRRAIRVAVVGTRVFMYRS